MLLQYGDIMAAAVRGEFDVFMHGCNCFHTMGAGVACLIKHKFPEAYRADLKTIKGDRNKLGTFSLAKVGDLIIANAYTQFNYGSKQQQVDYDAVRKCMRSARKMFTGKRIGMPKIGAGFGGGQWDIIANIIREELKDTRVTVMYL